ncbi:MAG TPA: formyl-CoA transferase [Sulfobacillus sp.]|nr:formyl-CoA transferase [Sulfobacillus sp.]
MTAPFEGLRIVDFTRILSGPYCTMFFGDMGAEVIKIEPPQGDDTRQWGPPFVGGESAYFLSVNRNKKSVVLDLKTEEGLKAIKQLIAQADVVVENFRPGTLDRLGLGFETLVSLNPHIILASISGFGQTGPYRDEPGYDVIAQGMGGMMSITGESGRPPAKPGLSLADVSAGMWAIIGILTAIHRRHSDPGPQWIDISLLESMMAFHTYAAGNYFATGVNPVPLGNAHPNICPYQAFAARDGYFNLAIGNDRLWEIFCRAVGHEEWIADSRFRTNQDRVTHRSELIPILEALFQTRSVSHWVSLLRQAKVPTGPIYQFSELYHDPYVTDRKMMFSLEHFTAGKVTQVALPVKFVTHPVDPKDYSAPPGLGQHTSQVLKDRGISPRE